MSTQTTDFGYTTPGILKDDREPIAVAILDARFRDYYEAVSTGHIRSARTGRVRRATPTPQGVLKVNLSAGGKTATVYVAKAVYEAHRGPIPQGHKLIHLDGDKRNCAIDNLDVETPEELRERLRVEQERRLYRPAYRGKNRPEIDVTHSHGRFKVAATCRRGHPLSMTGYDDDNTRSFGVNNRVCMTCSQLDVLPQHPNYHGHYGVSAAA